MTRKIGATFFDVVFDGPPGPESGRFVEVENERQEGVGDFGEWVQRPDGYWVLRHDCLGDPRRQALEKAMSRTVAAVDRLTVRAGFRTFTLLFLSALGVGLCVGLFGGSQLERQRTISWLERRGREAKLQEETRVAVYIETPNHPATHLRTPIQGADWLRENDLESLCHGGQRFLDIAAHLRVKGAR